MLLCIGMSQVMKLTYAHPRPYWVDSRVIGMTCETGFGHPSGHSGPPLFALYAVYTHYLSGLNCRVLVVLAMVCG